MCREQKQGTKRIHNAKQEQTDLLKLTFHSIKFLKQQTMNEYDTSSNGQSVRGLENRAISQKSFDTQL